MEPASGLTLGNCEYLREPAFLRVEPPYPFRNIYKSPQTPASTKATAAAVQSHAEVTSTLARLLLGIVHNFQTTSRSNNNTTSKPRTME